ncbi:MAG: asparagine synthase (glutamine-hydrolyzing) [Cyclobacteriaceae bacterium]
MCGITGILHFDREKKADSFILKKMTDSILHRGPDGEGHYLHNNVALGHRRLSIIDLNTGDQPMFNEDNSLSLVFNGEIYNYIELREELKRTGSCFKTDSDTEVIIKAYEKWGIKCQNRFNGMWAFALWDNNKQQLLLSRDRIGEKPLHYTIYENSLIFGSEIKSILAYGVPKIPNNELLEIYLSLGYIPAPYTFYKNIHKLKAGHCLIIGRNDIKERQYWDLPEIDEENMISNKKEVYEKFEDLFTDSVRLRMRSDVPYGAFLSGGLDSSSIVASMSEISSFPVETFTIGFKEKMYDERYLAKLVADKFNTNHHEFIVESQSFNESLDNIAFHFDEPFGDSSAIPTGYVSKFAASKVKMVLTGDGGDEVLSGYTTYQHEKFASQFKRLPSFVCNKFPYFLELISSPIKGSLKYYLNRARVVSFSSNMDFQSRYLYKTPGIDLAAIKQMTKDEKVYPIEEYLSDFMKKCTYKDPFYQLMYLNFKLSLPDDMLTKVDRMSMAYSLETRTPFLDFRLIEYMVNVHKDIKMKKYERKTVLRNSLGHKLPKQLLTASKKGFVVPLLDWFKEDSFSKKLYKLKESLPMVNEEIFGRIANTNTKEDKELGNFIWKLFVLNKIIN